MRHACLAACLLGCLSSACSSTDVVLPSELELLVGQELDTWVVDPPASRVQVDLVQASDGSRSKLVDVTAPASKLVDATKAAPTIELPEQHYTDAVFARFEATGTDASDAAVVRGTSVIFRLYGLHSVSIPLFLGRVGSWSRPPDELEHPHLHPVVGVALHAYLVAAGGDPMTGADLSVPDFYDVGYWMTLRRQPPLPRTPQSLAIVSAALLAINESGASWLNLTNDETRVQDPPDGLVFADIAGGDTITLPDDTQYIVGATRVTGKATDKVLRLDKNAKLTVLTLGTPRLGATAAVVGSTLVVAGGTADGPMVEVLNADQAAFASVALPADPTVGLGLAALDATTAIVAGGKDPTMMNAASPVRAFDTACATDCVTREVTTLPVALTRTKLFSLGPSQLLAVGEADDGENLAFTIDATGANPPAATPLRERRKGATPVLMPNGQVALVGGEVLDTGAPALHIEAFIP